MVLGQPGRAGQQRLGHRGRTGAEQPQLAQLGGGVLEFDLVVVENVAGQPAAHGGGAARAGEAQHGFAAVEHPQLVDDAGDGGGEHGGARLAHWQREQLVGRHAVQQVEPVAAHGPQAALVAAPDDDRALVGGGELVRRCAIAQRHGLAGDLNGFKAGLKRRSCELF